MKVWHGIPQQYALYGFMLLQIAALVAVGLYSLSGPMKPDYGLQQLDAITLHEKVAGLNSVDNTPTLVLAPGNLESGNCASQLRKFLDEFGKQGGVSAEFKYRVLQSTETNLLQTLGLKESIKSCSPGYVLLDTAGYVRYRTYDPQYEHHAGEQNILLEALRMNMTGMHHEK